eukprot:TRINITY_DN1421_c0_g1_i1.p1 TRINITY_DN1421_c0_g1~~TRINITY_DN1421_c0_g1_i1.p1  ORF type:complete len:2329 (+),score=518.76 TRINITY_DN1421_c0_g1_i1:65-7051(+)
MSGRRGRGRGRGPNTFGRGTRGRGGRTADASGGRAPRPEGQPREPVVLEAIEVHFKTLTPHELREIKNSLLNIVAAALIQQPKASVNDPIMRRMIVMVKKIAFYDPEFVLKLAMYVRLDLNIRSTANFLLAVASNIKECQPYFKKYFGSTIRLPSDWLDVAATYQTLPDKSLKGKSLPTCLRKTMVGKFPDFDPYQLGKYNKERSIKKKIKKMKEEKEKNPSAAGPKDQKPMLTIKQLIRQLHIAKPTYNVMCLLGKKYPNSESQFRELELPGKFEEDKSGRRMKLPVPETWETLLSEKGNKASTWEELIEHKKLPFMAMLRNIRNLIYSGVHPRYHKWVQNKLSNAVTIAQSKQFPFSFFSAYEVIPRDMEHFKQLISGEDKDKKKDKKPAEAPAGGEAAQPMRRKKKKQILPAIMPTQKVFDDYRTALDQAVKHATVHNVQPIRGTTVVFCNVSRETRENTGAAKGMGQSVRNIQEVGYMLGLMCKYVCEDCDFQIYSSPSDSNPETNHLSVDLIEGTILDNMKVVAEKAKLLGAEGIFPYDYLEDMIRDKRRVDNLLVLSHQVINPGQGQNQLANLLNKYRSEVNPDMLFVSVDLSGSGRSTIGSDDKHPLDIMITGFSDQILRFIAERGDQNQLQYVEHIDEAKNLNVVAEKQEYEVSPWWRWLDTLGQEQEVVRYPNIVSGTPWRTIRVFISSTFLDMHGERDVLTRIVFPELKERAKQRKLDIVEVDLRWGVTEEESQQGKSIELCLSEVERCKPFFVGILGNRYGWAPEDYDVPDQPRFRWLKNYPKGRSITELEMELAALSDPSSANGAFFYFRNPNFIADVPDNLLRSFLDESEASKDKLDSLKERIRSSGLPVYEDYPCSFGGVNDGKPTTTNLTEFAERVFQDLWKAIDAQYPAEPVPEDPIESERSYHQAFVQTLTSNFTGRKTAMEQLNRHVEGARTQLMIVNGKPGDGKSALLANFARECALKDDKSFVLSHFIGASPGSTDVRKTLYRLCSELKLAYGLDDEIPSDFKELCNIFPKLLEEATFKGKLVIVLDALNQLDEKIHRSHSLDWLPAKLPCKLIVSTTEGTCLTSLQHKYQFAYTELKLGPLEVKERADLVRETLWRFHKKLDERPMNNQMRVLLKKFDAGSPLYLSVACEELRVFGVYEKVSDRIKSMGDKIPKLFDEVLNRLETDHGKSLVQDVCSFIAISKNGILERELRGLVGCTDYSWSGFLRSLSPFLKPIGDQGELSFFHQQFYVSVIKKYLSSQRLIQKFHARIAEYLYERSDPLKDGTWKGGNDTRAVRELPYHLVLAEKFDDVVNIMTDLFYIELKISLGQTFDLLEDYNFAIDIATNYEGKKKVVEFKNFVQSNANVLQHNPSLTFQQAANQPDHTEPAKRASDRWKNSIETRTWVKWNNKPEESDLCKQTYSGNQESITSGAFSPNGKIIAAASRDCVIHLFNAETGSELFALTGHSNWIVDLKFSPDGSQLASASWDESTKIWDVDSGRLVTTYNGHNRRINSCSYSHDGALLATASWDCTVKVWNTRASEKDAWRTIQTGDKPVNSVTFSPDDKKIVVGTWDGKIKEFEIENGTLVSTLTGHKKSVQTVAYEPSGNHMVSGGLDNSLMLWDAQAGKLIAELTKHGKQVTSVAYTTDGSHVLSSSADATTRVWQANLGRQRKVVKIKDAYMNCCTYDPTSDERLATGSSDCLVHIWDITEGTIKVTFEGHTRPVIACEYSFDGKYLATGSEDGVLIVWDVEKGEKIHTLPGHTASITSISWSPNDHRFASGSDDFTIRIWDAKKGALSIPLLSGHTNAVKGVCFDPKGKLLATAARDNTLRIWDTRNGNCLHTLRGHKDWLNAVHVSPTGNKVVTCSWDFTLMFWNIRKGGDPVATLKGHQSSVSSCKFSPDGKTVVSGSFDGTLKIWDAESGTEITTLVGHAARVNGFCFSKDGGIASVSDDGTIKLWDPLASTEVATLVGHSAPVRSGAFSPANKQIVTVSDDKTLKIWDVGLHKEESSSFGFGYGNEKEEEEVKETQRISGHKAQINQVHISTDGHRILSVSDDTTFALWDAATAVKLRQISRPEPRPFKSGQFSADGQLIVTASDDGDVVLWDARTRDLVRVVVTHSGPATSVTFGVDDNSVISGGWDNKVRVSDFRKTNTSKSLDGHEDWILSVASSGDRRYFVSSGWDTNIRLWNASPASEKSVLLGHSKTVTSVSFSSDSRYIASSSYDSCVKIWSATNAKLEKTLAGHEGNVNATVFGPKSENILLSAGADHTVKIWDVASGNLKNEFICQGPATALSLAKPGSTNELVMVFGDSIGNINLSKLVYH